MAIDTRGRTKLATNRMVCELRKAATWLAAHRRDAAPSRQRPWGSAQMTPSIFLSASLRCEHSTWSGPHATSSRVAGCTRRRTSCARRPRASPPCCCCYSAGEPCAAKSAEHRRARAAADRLLALVQTDCSGPLGLSSSTRQQAGRPSSAEVPPAVLQLYLLCTIDVDLDLLI
jgi:hypothetical protein